MGLISFFRRHVSPGGAAFLQVILLIAVLGAANMLAFSTQVQWDLSENRAHSLSPLTTATLQRLATPVRVLLVAQDPGEVSRDSLRLLESLPRVNPRITFEFLEKGPNAERVAKYQIPRDRFLVVESGACFRWVPRLSEQNLLAAILQAARGGDRKVLFSHGAGELDLAGLDERGMGKARDALAQGGFRPVQDAITPETLKDAAVVVIAAPANELPPQTASLLRDYIANGGGLLALLDPPPAAGLSQFLAAYDIRPVDKKLLELNNAFRPSGYAADALFAPLTRSDHPITTWLSPAERILLINNRPLALPAPAQGLLQKPQALPLIASSANSGYHIPSSQRGVDLVGPCVAAAATIEPPSVAGKGRVMVIGSSAPITNRFIATAGNREFLDLSVSWLSGSLDAPILAQDAPVKRFNFTGISDWRLRTLFLVCGIALPGLSAICALVVFIRRAG